MEKDSFIKIGKLSRAHGLKGEIRGMIDPSVLPRVKKMNVLFLHTGGKLLPYFIEHAELDDSGSCLFKFEEVNDRTQAERISGKEIFIEEKNLKKNIKLSGYSFLTGYKMLDEMENEIGVIENTFQMPANELAQLIIDKKEVLVPLTEESVIRIDKRKKEATIRIPEGLLDIYLK